MDLNFSSTFRKVFMSVVFSLMLIPAFVSASSEFKGTETVNINKANASTLSAYLTGVGPSKAEAIVKYRKTNGNFKKIDDLKNVPGIGDETYKDMKKNVSTSRGKSVAPDGYKMGKATSSSSKKASKKSTAKKSTSSSSSNSSSSSSKKSSKVADVEKKSTAKKTASKKSSTSKKTSSKKATPKKTSTSKKATTKKKITSKKKPAKKKTTKKKTTKEKK